MKRIFSLIFASMLVIVLLSSTSTSTATAAPKHSTVSADDCTLNFFEATGTFATIYDQGSGQPIGIVSMFKNCYGLLFAVCMGYVGNGGYFGSVNHCFLEDYNGRRVTQDFSDPDGTARTTGYGPVVRACGVIQSGNLWGTSCTIFRND